ncbi:hypothetical protein ACPYOC_05550 [Ornithinimicrobium sp. W1665]|uniref:hypothetical protein n=1 Tax=Ornithinimicrobium sp. W1665 TaxID=3416666 RepID=UPI003CF61B85
MATRTAYPVPSPTSPTAAGTGPLRRARRTALVAGLVWLVAGVGTFAPESPGPGTDATGIRAHVEQNLDVLTLNAASSLVAVVALLALVSALVTVLQAEGPGGTASRYVLGAGTLAAVQMVFFHAVYAVWLFVDPAALGDTEVRALYAAGLFADAFGSLALVVTCSMVGLVSWLALGHRFLSRPVAVLGLLVAAGELVSLGQLLGENPVSSTGMYVAIFGWFLWPAVVGVDLGIRLRRR